MILVDNYVQLIFWYITQFHQMKIIIVLNTLDIEWHIPKMKLNIFYAIY